MKYKDYHELRLLAIKPLLEEEHFETLAEMFPFLNKKDVAERAKIGYNRFKNLVENRPEKFTIAEIERLAWVLGIESYSIIQLLEVQIKVGTGIKP